MSKELADILGRLNGNMMALAGMESKYAPPPPLPPPTMEQAATAAVIPPPPLTKEKKADYDYTKKLLDDIAALAKSASEEIDKQLKIPPPPGAEGETSASPSPSGAHSEGSAAHKETSSTHKK